jgi:hypothetical protein
MAASDAGSASSGTPETNNCSDIRLLLSAYVDNEATPEEAAQARTHIAACADCASHFAFLRLTSRALSQTPEVFPSASLSARIAAATYERPTFADRIAGWLRPAPVRVGLGAAMAAGLAMVLIVPRMGEMNTVTLPQASETDAGKTATREKAVKGTTSGVTKPTPQKAPAKTTNIAKVSEPRPGTTDSVKPPAAKPAIASAQPKSLSEQRPAPVVIAGTPRRKSLESLNAPEAASLNVNDVLLSARAEPRIDRVSSKRTAGNSVALKKPGAGVVMLPRSGYDRAAATEKVLKTRENAVSASSVATRITPLPDGNAGKLAEPTASATERTASTPVESTAVSVASSAAAETPQRTDGILRFRIKSSRAKDSANVALPDVSQRGIGNLSANDRYSFAAGNAAHIGITSAPVQ